MDEKNEMMEPEMTVGQPVEAEDAAVFEAEAEADGQEVVPEEIDAEANFALQSQIRDELYEAVSAEKVDTPWGQESRYFMLDYDTEAGEVYCEDHQDWKIYSFRYSMSGDAVTVDFNSKTRKKFAFVDFDEGEQTSVFASAFDRAAEAVDHLKNANAELEGKFDSVTSDLKSANAELENLRQFKADAVALAEQAKRNAVMDRFEDLNGLEEFEALRENVMEYSEEALEEKCFAIRGRNMNTKFTAAPRTPKIVVPDMTQEKNDEPYGGVFARYDVGQD